MNVEMLIWALLFFTFGVYSLGRYSGERGAIWRFRIHPVNGSNDAWFFMGMVAIAVSVVLAIAAVHPAEELIEHANKIRPSVSTER